MDQPVLEGLEAHTRLSLLRPTPSGSAWRVVREKARPVRERTRKQVDERSRCGFPVEEWETLCEAPRRAFEAVVGAGLEAEKARRALVTALEEASDSRSPLVGRVCAEALRRLEEGGPVREARPLDEATLGALCRQVDERLGLGEGERFRRCLHGVAERGALAASGLRGLFGRTGAGPRRALETLAAALR